MNNRDEMNLIGRGIGYALTSRVLGWQVTGTAFAAVLVTVLSMLSVDKAPAISFLISGIGFIGAYTFLFGTSVVVVRLVSTKAEDKQEASASPLHFVVDTLGQSLMLPIIIAVCGVLTAAIFCGFAALWRWDVWQSILVIPAALLFVAGFSVAALIFASMFITPALLCVEQPGMQELIKRLHITFRYRTFDAFKAVFIGLAAGIFIALPVVLATRVVHNIIIWIYDISAAGAPVNDFAAFILNIEYALLVVTPAAAAALAIISATAYAAYETFVDEEPQEEAAREDELKIESPEGVTVPEEALSDITE